MTQSISPEAREAAEHIKRAYAGDSDLPQGIEARIQSAIDAALTSERELADRLHEALREHAVKRPAKYRMGCLQCDTSWSDHEAEVHCDTCLAAPTLRPEK